MFFNAFHVIATKSAQGCFVSMDLKALTEQDIDRIIEMAWEDRTPFEAIAFQFGLSEAKVIELMRSQLKTSSFRMWRKRVTGRTTKHLKIRPEGMAQEARHTAQLNVAKQK